MGDVIHIHPSGRRRGGRWVRGGEKLMPSLSLQPQPEPNPMITEESRKRMVWDAFKGHMRSDSSDTHKTQRKVVMRIKSVLGHGISSDDRRYTVKDAFSGIFFKQLGNVADKQYGALSARSDKTGIHIGVGADFVPAFDTLWGHRGTAERAAEVTAIYVYAHALFVKGYQNYGKRQWALPTGVSTINESVWDTDVISNPDIARKVVPYRFAGFIALGGNEGTHFKGNPGIPEGGLPPHVAGLVNPLDIDQVWQLHSVIKNSLRP